jgi:hypothetical protein
MGAPFDKRLNEILQEYASTLSKHLKPLRKCEGWTILQQ